MYQQVKTFFEDRAFLSKKHYVNNADLYQAMIEYKKLYNEGVKNNQTVKIPEYIGECIMLIANKVSCKPNFINYSYRDEMVADGIENCILYLHNFDPDKTQNPFAYITQIIVYAFIRRIQKEKKYQYIKLKNLQNSLTEQEVIDNNLLPKQMYDNNSEYIADYETSMKEKKIKSKTKVGIEKFIDD